MIQLLKKPEPLCFFRAPYAGFRRGVTGGGGGGAVVNIWASAYMPIDATSNNLVFTATFAYQQWVTLELLSLEGEEVEFTVEANTGAVDVLYVCRNANGDVFYLLRDGTYYNNGTTSNIGAASVGDKYKWKIGGGYVQFFKKSGGSYGSALVTSPSSFTLPLTHNGTRFWFYWQSAGYNGLIFTRPVTNSSLL